jgi:hypothetical protein
VQELHGDLLTFNAFSTFQQLNQIMVFVVCASIFFQFALKFVTLNAFSTFQQLNQIMVFVVCASIFFSFAFKFVTLNAFSKVNPTYGACASTSLINFWFMFTYDL